MFSDRLAQLKENCGLLCQQISDKNGVPHVTVSHILGEVNVGALNAHYEGGETVEISSLKEKKLINPECKRIKILARGELDKPLTIYAESFSQKAIEKIKQQGGRAIQVPSPSFQHNRFDSSHS